MAKLPRPKSICRTTMDKITTEALPHAGIYIIAYMRQVVYIGKAEASVADRLRVHYTTLSPLGIWMRKVEQEWENVRLDVLEMPDDQDDHWWIFDAETRLIKKFSPLLNIQLQSS